MVRSAVIWLAAALLVAAALLAKPVDACNCANGGSVATSVPCRCTCPSGWFPPTCEFTANQQVQVLMSFRNATASSWTTSGEKIQAFYDQYNLRDADNGDRAMRSIRRLTAREPADRSVLKLVVMVRGYVVDRIVSDGSSSAFAQRISLVGIEYLVSADAAPGALAGSPIITNVAAGNYTIPIPVHAVAFPLGALAVLILIPVSESVLGCCCASSGAPSEDDEMMRAYRRKQQEERRQREAAEAAEADGAVPNPFAGPRSPPEGSGYGYGGGGGGGDEAEATVSAMPAPADEHNGPAYADDVAAE